MARSSAICATPGLDMATMARPMIVHASPLQENPMIELTLPDMTCGHCVKTVTRTVQQIDAAARLEVDLPTHKVRIESTQPPQAFVKALADEGYPTA
jgi:copper chaperone